MTKLIELAETADERDCETIWSELESFAASAELGGDVTERILSSVMRKAGFEMNENIISEKRKKYRRNIFVIIVAASLLAVGAVGAGAHFMDKRAVLNGMNHFFTDSENTAENELDALAEITSVNGKITLNNFDGIDITFEGSVCEGTKMYSVFTLRKKDGTPFTAPDGYKWTSAYYEVGMNDLLFSIRRKFLTDFEEHINEDGSLSITIGNTLDFSDDKKYSLGFTGLYCVPENGLSEITVIGEKAAEAEFAGDIGLFDKLNDEYISALENVSEEYITGSMFCEIYAPDTSAAEALHYNSVYKNVEINVDIDPLEISLSYMGAAYDFDIDRTAPIEIFYTDGTSEMAGYTAGMIGGNDNNRDFYLGFSTGRPIDPYAIDHLVYEGETIDLNKK